MISIIIPTLNEAACIGKTVAFLRANGGPDLQEIIVADAESPDGTAAIAQAAGATIVKCPARSRAAQMNAGARAARGSVLYFVHADTLPPATFLADIRAALAAGHSMGCFRYRFDSDSFWLKINAWFNRFGFLWCQGGDKTFFIRKEIFEALGGYDERFVIMEEYAFIQKATKQYKLPVLPCYATVSARKYEHNSWLRVQVANFLIFNLFRAGVEPIVLKRIYKKLLAGA